MITAILLALYIALAAASWHVAQALLYYTTGECVAATNVESINGHQPADDRQPPGEICTAHEEIPVIEACRMLPQFNNRFGSLINRCEDGRQSLSPIFLFPFPGD